VTVVDERGANGEEGRTTAERHTTRCYLYSPDADPEVLPETAMRDAR
jgi:hypothetical protein